MTVFEGLNPNCSMVVDSVLGEASLWKLAGVKELRDYRSTTSLLRTGKLPWLRLLLSLDLFSVLE
jgi:hypothetical protein